MLSERTVCTAVGLGSLQNTSVGLESHENARPLRGKKKKELPFPTLSTATWCLFQLSPMLEKRVESPLVLCKEICRCLFLEGDSGWMEVAELWRRSGFQQHRSDDPR